MGGEGMVSSVSKERFALETLPTYLMIISIGLFMSVVCALTTFSFDISDFGRSLINAVTFCALGMLLRGIGLARAATIAEGWGISIPFSVLVAAASLVLAGMNLPLQDDLLVALDKNLLGFSWLNALNAIPYRDQVMNVMAFVYCGMGLETLIALILFIGFLPINRSWIFINAWNLALTMCLIISALMPAIANFHYYGLDWRDFPGLDLGFGIANGGGWTAPQMLLDVRSGLVRDIGIEHLAGIMTFPSFHCASAILFVWGFWHFKYVRIPALILNGVMIVSSLFIGGHYLVDAVAGSLLAVFAIWLATQWDYKVQAIKARRALDSAPQDDHPGFRPVTPIPVTA